MYDYRRYPGLEMVSWVVRRPDDGLASSPVRHMAVSWIVHHPTGWRLTSRLRPFDTITKRVHLFLLGKLVLKFACTRQPRSGMWVTKYAIRRSCEVIYCPQCLLSASIGSAVVIQVYVDTKSKDTGNYVRISQKANSCDKKCVRTVAGSHQYSSWQVLQSLSATS